LVGNDIVDLDFCEPGQYDHVRHIDRVCTLEEANAIRRSVHPVRALALVWASKEAAYKRFSKQFTQCHFVPREFAIQMENQDPARIDRKLSILYKDLQTEVSIVWENRWVHAVASPAATKILFAVREIDRCFLGSRRASNESEAVRFLANDLLEQISARDVSLQFEGRVPKLKNKDGDLSGMDVSLAHHGAFAAAAIAWPMQSLGSLLCEGANSKETTVSEAVCFTCIA
jgi:phosphopantetheinyl transferase (holo-ACP synthase)